MKKITGFFVLILSAQFLNAQLNSKLTAYAQDYQLNANKQLNYIQFKESYQVKESEAADFINLSILNNGANKVQAIKTDRDELGYTHIRYAITQLGYTVANKIIIAHCYAGKLISLNGDLLAVKAAANSFVISEQSALNAALNKVKAQKYKWQNKEEERHMRVALNQPDFSYYPKGEKVVIEIGNNVVNAYEFNIYAETPLYRANVFVDASTGKILDEQNLICTTDVPANANTKFSGTQTITCDQTPTLFRLREVARGLGVETYNMKNTSTYSSTDFTNTTTTWTTTGVDQAATDAHWGAEKTYDYYFQKHNRNSINNAGFKLLSYVHYQTTYSNAFWDGQRMTYGDGNGGSMKIFTALDVCGHEITHGLTSNTGNLTYSNESGALNESFSDIFGTCIENFGRPTNWNWKIGEDVTNGGGGLRIMSNPNSFGDPDTYLGTNYYTGTADNGGVHTNSGVSNFWFYLLTMGGSGTNDISNTYSVSALGFTSASKIAFRALTVYFTPSTNFLAARNSCIQAAKDLFGPCSNEVAQTANAWYAVGVGTPITPGVVGTNFTSATTGFCGLPATVNFSNTTTNGTTYTWYFGDGATANSTNAVHTYTAAGIYNVKLIANSCSIIDSLIKPSFVVVNVPSSPTVGPNIQTCANSVFSLSASGNSIIKWYASPSAGTPLATGSTFTASNLTTNTTYYVTNAVPNPAVIGGRLTISNGGYLASTNAWEVFNVTQNCILNSVIVQAQVAGLRVIELRDNTSATIYSTFVNLSVGTNTVLLGYNITVGNGYQLGLASGSTGNLYRSNSGSTYPYNIGGCVNITGSNLGAAYYFFFYTWSVSKADCESVPLPVSVNITPAPAVSITTPSATICKDDVVSLSGTPTGGAFSGAGVTGTNFNASALGLGSHAVIYTYTDVTSGCASSDSVAMKVESCTGLSKFNSTSSFDVYPNPFSGSFTIKSDAFNSTKVIMTNALGEVIIHRSMMASEEKIDMSAYPKGVYILTITDELNHSNKSIKLIKS